MDGTSINSTLMRAIMKNGTMTAMSESVMSVRPG